MLDNQQSVEEKIDEISAVNSRGINAVIHVLPVENPENPEKFYEISEQRVYLEIDGKPVEQYFAEK